MPNFRTYTKVGRVDKVWFRDESQKLDFINSGPRRSRAMREMDIHRLLESERLQMQQIRELDMEELQIEVYEDSDESPDSNWLPENERLQMQQIRELDMEELQIEEVDEASDDDEDNFLVSTATARFPHTLVGQGRVLAEKFRPTTTPSGRRRGRAKREMDPDRLLANERMQMQQIRELDLEELQIEEVDEASSDDDDENGLVRHIDGQAGDHYFTFDTCLASLHSYLGEVDETHGRLAFLDGGAILNLPMFYLKGVVLFPEATLPLRVILPRFKAAVERALHQVDAPYTIGVMRVHWRSDDGRVRFGITGTTAEIRQYRRLDDGSLNVVARGQQRFRMRRSWIDMEGVPCAEVQIVKEDIPIRTPKDAFAQLASVTDFRKRHYPSAKMSGFSPLQLHNKMLTDNDWECMSSTSNGSDNSDIDLKFCLSGYDSFGGYERIQECSSSDEEEYANRPGRLKGKSRTSKSHGLGQDYTSGYVGKHHRPDLDLVKDSTLEKKASRVKCGATDGLRRIPRASLSFWPEWIYQMHDSYALARRVAELWKKIVGAPKLDDYIRKPDILSFHIGSKLPVSESTRQELLEIDGISYRLRREIQLLESFNHIRCKSCLTLIANRSDMVVMSSDGPLNAYVNPHGYVHEIITVYKATGLALIGSPDKEHSWFPGYAWTITNCAHCDKNMGWLFTAIKKKLLPKSFWGIRSSQVVDDTMLD